MCVCIRKLITIMKFIIKNEFWFGLWIDESDAIKISALIQRPHLDPIQFNETVWWELQVVGCAGRSLAAGSLSEWGALASSLASSSYSVMGRCSVNIFFTSESVEPKLSDSATQAHISLSPRHSRARWSCITIARKPYQRYSRQWLNLVLYRRMTSMLAAYAAL